MIGYIYKTTNKINGRLYIGKHEKSEYDPNYYGSGYILMKAIKLYGIENFENELLVACDTIEELNAQEKKFIKEYKEAYGKKCYNIADGGDGGNTLRYASEERKQEFVEKMTKINQERCGTEEFRSACSKRTKVLYSDPEERKKHAIEVKKAWSNPKLLKEQSERVTEWHKTHSIDRTYQQKRCCITINDLYKEFDSLKACEKFLKEEFGAIPSNLKTLTKPYVAFHTRMKPLNGLTFRFLND